MIGKLLGHKHVHTTARYAHLGRETVYESAVRISESIALAPYEEGRVAGRRS